MSGLIIHNIFPSLEPEKDIVCIKLFETVMLQGAKIQVLKQIEVDLFGVNYTLVP